MNQAVCTDQRGQQALVSLAALCAGAARQPAALLLQHGNPKRWTLIDNWTHLLLANQRELALVAAALKLLVNLGVDSGSKWI